MLRADYDPEGDTLAIELVDVDRLDYGDDSAHPQAIVSFREGRPAVIDVIGASAGVAAPLAAVASRCDLDLSQLRAAARSALVAPAA